MDTIVTAPPAARTAPRDYLAALNSQQRAAVEYGIVPGQRHQPCPGALLVIAGAGSGKTNTLAYRVAHAVRNGADPFRLLLLTFSRRSAVEMERRTGRILNTILGNAADQAPPIPLLRRGLLEPWKPSQRHGYLASIGQYHAKRLARATRVHNEGFDINSDGAHASAPPGGISASRRSSGSPRSHRCETRANEPMIPVSARTSHSVRPAQHGYAEVPDPHR